MVREYFQTHANTMCNRMVQRGGGKHLVSTTAESAGAMAWNGKGKA